MNNQKLCYSIPEVVTATGLCRDRIYSAIRERKLLAHKFGSRTLELPGGGVR